MPSKVGRPRKKQVTIFGRRLADARKKAGLSLQELASLIGVSSPQVINKWETGSTALRADQLVAISKALNVSIDYLIGFESNFSQKIRQLLEIASKISDADLEILLAILQLFVQMRDSKKLEE